MNKKILKAKLKAKWKAKLRTNKKAAIKREADLSSRSAKMIGFSNDLSRLQLKCQEITRELLDRAYKRHPSGKAVSPLLELRHELADIVTSELAAGLLVPQTFEYELTTSIATSLWATCDIAVASLHEQERDKVGRIGFMSVDELMRGGVKISASRAELEGKDAPTET